MTKQCRLFMKPDLATKEWRLLSGYVIQPRVTTLCPGSRVLSLSSWVEKGCFWIFRVIAKALDLRGSFTARGPYQIPF